MEDKTDDVLLLWKVNEKYTPFDQMSEKCQDIAKVVMERAKKNDGLFDASIMYCFNNMIWFSTFLDDKKNKSEKLIECLSKSQLATVKTNIKKMSEEELAKFFKEFAENSNHLF